MKPWKWIVGLDYSMTCPAITIANLDIPFSFSSCQLRYLSDKIPKKELSNIIGNRLEHYISNEERFDRISTWAVNSIFECTNGEPTVVFIEDYSFASKGKTFNIGENTGLVKHRLFKLNIPIFSVPPTVIKKFALKGNATKDQLYDVFVDETGIELMPIYQPKAKTVGSPTGDLIDSYYMAKYGYYKG